jgi:RHS repeat-associated protein
MFATTMRWAWVAVLAALWPGSAIGQSYIQTSVDGTTPPVLAGGAPAGSYALSNFESVNLFSGNLNFALPLVEIGGRGEARYTATLRIEKRWNIEKEVLTHVGAGPGEYYIDVHAADPVNTVDNFLGAAYLMGRRGATPVPCVNGNGAQTASLVLTRYSLVSADGTETEFRDRMNDGRPLSNANLTAPCGNSLGRGTEFKTSDASGSTLMLGTALTDITSSTEFDPSQESFGENGYGVLKSGVRYVFGPLLNQIVDRNGNTVSFGYDANAGESACGTKAGIYPTRAVDSLGRSFKFCYSEAMDEIRFTGAGAQARSIKVHYGLLSTALFNAANCTNPASNGQMECLFPAAQRSGSGALSPRTLSGPYDPRVVTGVELPDGRLYSFRYNEYRELTKVTLPTGGVIEYEWGKAPEVAGLGYSGVKDIGGGPAIVYRRVLKRTTKPNGSAVEGIQTYTPEVVVPTGIAVVVEHRKPDNTVVRKEKHYFYGRPEVPGGGAVAYTDWKNGKEFKTEYIDPSTGAVVKTDEQTWKQRTTVAWYPGSADSAPPADPVLDFNKTKWAETGAELFQTYSYDQYSNRTYEVTSWKGTAIRTRSVDYVTGPSYTDPPVHLRSLVSSEVEYSGGSYTLSRNFYYDCYGGGWPTLVTRPAVTGYTAPSSNWRGNPCYVRNSAPSTVETKFQYDQLGNVVKVFHPPANIAVGAATGTQAITNIETSYAFDDSWVGSSGGTATFAFPTSVLRTGGGQTLTTSMKYDYWTGQTKSFKDPNNQETTYDYTDPLDRIKSITQPIGTTTFAYDATLGANKVTTTKSINASTNRVDSRQVDGFGRVVKTGTSYSEGTSFVEQAYDALGRVEKVSLPHRSTPSWTTTVFDGVGRAVSVTHPDGSSVKICNQGPDTFTKDEAGRWTKREYDGAGRLTAVVEDPNFSLTAAGCTNTNGLDYATTYGLDAEGRVTSVIQGGRNRTFSYDALGRLVSAANPESGTTTYAYDQFGNLMTKADGRVTANYVHDAFGRVKTIRYTGAATPGVDFCYDGVQGAALGADCSGAPAAGNSLGRMTQVKSTSATVQYLAYDALGRVTSHKQTVGSDNHQFGYTYDHLGMTGMVYPSTRAVTFGDIDASGMRKSVTGTSLYAKITSVAPHGAAAVVALGPTGAVAQTVTFNTRQQVSSYNAARSGGGTVLKIDNYFCAGRPASCTANSGDIYERELSHTATADESAWTRGQEFGYDKLGRLTDFKEAGATVETNGYDRWGNRFVTAGAPSGAGVPSNASAFDVKNQVTGVGYDGSGNRTGHSPLRLEYDGENRISKAELLNGSGVVTETTEYFYDGNGRRVRKVWTPTGGTPKTTTFVYDAGGELAAEYGAAQAGAPSGTKYVVSDYMGTTRALVDSAGVVDRRYDYRPFGDEIGTGVGGRSTKFSSPAYPGAGDGMSVKFTGKERDAETGLDYFEARYLSSAQGRFTSPDKPFADQHLENPQSWNLYSYTRNNPLAFVDPTGRGAVSTGVKAAAHALETRLLNAARAEGVRRAWKQEVELIRRTGQGSREWTEAQVGEMMTRGKVRGFEGHHINSVKGSDLKMAADPNNIKFVEGRAGNLAEHGGNFQNKTSGPLIDRIAKLGGAGMLAFFATFDQKMNEYSSQSPIISSPDSFWSNVNPVNYLVENAALAEAFVAADNADRKAKKREEEERKKQGGS